MQIVLFRQPFSASLPEWFEAGNVAHWLLARYGDTPQVAVQVFRGEPCGANEISQDVAALLASDAPVYSVLESPGTGIDISYVIMAVFMVASILLTPKPVMPGNINRSQQSPNNALSNRSNEVRAGERVEDIFGSVKSIPAVLMPAYIKYLNHMKYEYGLYSIGRGYYDVTEIKDGDTLIKDIPSASAAVYWPFSSPNMSGQVNGVWIRETPVQQIGPLITDQIITAARASEVDGIVLHAPNEGQLPELAWYWLSGGPGVPYTIEQQDPTPNFNIMVKTGDHITIDYPHDQYHSEHVVLDVQDKRIIVNQNGVNWPIAPRGYQLRVQIVKNAPEVARWITLPAADRTEVWCNVIAQNGLFKDNGVKNGTEVGFTVEIEKLDEAMAPTGITETVLASISGATSDERAVTIEHRTAWTGPARVRVFRTGGHDYTFGGTVQDEIKWSDLYAISPVDKSHFGNKTIIHTITQANQRATSVKSREVNCQAARLIPRYNGYTFSGALDASGRHISGTLHKTSRIVDIIAAVSVDPLIGNRDLQTDVDMPQIYAVQRQLDEWNPVCGQFNYTFDTDKTSYEETLVMIANAGFCIAYRQNGKIRLAMDGPKLRSSALFTHRNKKPRSEKIMRTFANDADFDGVEFVYMDPDSHTQETITLPLDKTYNKAKKFEIAGIQNFAQAWLRAHREYQKLLGQRITIETTTTMDARLLLPNSRVDIVDNTRFKSYDGEVVGQNGLVLTLGREVQFTPGEPHSLVLMRRDGSLQSIACTPGPRADQVVLQQVPAEAIVTVGGEEGIRTIYSFASDSSRHAMAYLVQEIDLSDGQYATIRAVNYSDQYWRMDKAPIPDKKTIIH